MRDKVDGSAGSARDGPGWVEPVARVGYVAKGIVYAVIGGLAAARVAGAGGETSGSRQALREIAQAPMGTVALAMVTVGLVAYVIWRLVQAIWDPDADSVDDHEGVRWAVRAFYFLSAVVYGSLAFAGAALVLGEGGGGGGSGSGGWASELMSRPWGVWLVGAVGLGIVLRGCLQFWKAYSKSFAEKLGSFDVSSRARSWIMGVARFGHCARGVVFSLIGGSVVYSSLTHDPSEARGLEGALEALAGRPWLLAAIGAGLIGYAVYQWTKARYRLIGV